MGKYKQYKTTKYLIKGKLSKIDKKVALANGNHKCPPSYNRQLFADENNNWFCKFNGVYWKFPEEVEYCYLIDESRGYK